jgi:hypothetical protein
MFIGHYAVALAAKKVAPRTSLGTLFISVQLVDLLWPLMLLLGLEHVKIDPGNTAVTPLDFYDYPITHSLLGAFVWSAVFGGIYFAVRRYRRGALVLGLGVLSHWILDFITHRPDLPLGFGGTYLGLGLWNSLPGTIVVEAGLFIGGLILYLRSTRTNDRIGTYGLWALAAVLVAIYVANVFGPPPPDSSAIAVAGNAMWLFVLWAYWVDRHRTLSNATATETVAESE